MKGSGAEIEHTLVNVGQDTALRNGDVSQELVQLLIVADGKLQMSGDDTRLLVVASSISCQLKNFGSEVLEDSSEVNGSTRTNTLSVVALAKKAMNTANRERQTGLGRTTSAC